MLLGRLFSYPDTHRYRIGTNYLQLPINQPQSGVHSYNKDGAMRYRHSGAQPVYAPNSYAGPVADPRYAEVGWGAAGDMVRAASSLHREDDDFSQPGMLVGNVMDEAARARLVANIVSHLGNGVSPEVLARAIAYWRNVDDDLGVRVAKDLGKAD